MGHTFADIVFLEVMDIANSGFCFVSSQTKETSYADKKRPTRDERDLLHRQKETY